MGTRLMPSSAVGPNRQGVPERGLFKIGSTADVTALLHRWANFRSDFSSYQSACSTMSEEAASLRRTCARLIPAVSFRAGPRLSPSCGSQPPESRSSCLSPRQAGPARDSATAAPILSDQLSDVFAGGAPVPGVDLALYVLFESFGKRNVQGTHSHAFII